MFHSSLVRSPIPMGVNPMESSVASSWQAGSDAQCPQAILRPHCRSCRCYSQLPVPLLKQIKPVAEAYVCDPSAVAAIQARQAGDLHADGPLFSAENVDTWEVWRPLAGTDLGTPVLIGMVFDMTDATYAASTDPSLYDSIAALLQVHSAHADFPRSQRWLVTNNKRFWELFFSSEEERKELGWAILTAGGGRQLVRVKRLWELVED